MESLGDILKRIAKGSMVTDGENPLQLPVDEPVADVCPHCRGARVVRRTQVSIHDPEFGKPVPCPTCHDEVQVSLTLRARARLPEAQRDYTFAGLRARKGLDSQQSEQYAAATRAAIAMANGTPNRPWLLMPGPNGVGKTHLAVCIANYRFDHPELNLPLAVFANIPELMGELRDAIREDFEARIVAYETCPLLILDDVGAEKSTEWVVEQLYRILNHRYAARLPLVVTTNLALDQMEPRIGSRLNDTGTELVEVCPLTLLPDLRQTGR